MGGTNESFAIYSVNKRIYERDEKICRYCGKPLTLEEATIDHIVPKSKGGERLKRENKVTACRPCNQKKGNKLISPILGKGTAKPTKKPRKIKIYTAKKSTQWRKVPEGIPEWMY